MKKRLLFLTVLVVALVALLAISASADTYGEATIYYFDSEVDALSSKSVEDAMLWCTRDANDVITAYSGSLPKTNQGGEAISWYKLGQAIIDDNTVFVAVKSFVTTDTAYCTINASNGMYKFTSSSGVTKQNIVSINFPNDAGIKSFSDGSAYGFYAQTGDYKPANSELLFAYFPNTWRESNRIVQATPVLEVYIDPDAPFDQITGQVYEGGILNDTAFFGCWSIRKIVFPKALKTIKDGGNGYGSMYLCTNLESVTFPEGCNLEYIGHRAFGYCTSLEELKLPNTVTTIKDRAFEHCYALNKLWLSEKLSNISVGQSLLWESRSLQYLYLSKNVLTATSSISGSHVFHGTGLKGVIFFTGSLTELNTLKGLLASTDNQQRINHENYLDWNSEDYKNWTDTQFVEKAVADGKYYVVYNYNNCNAFYDAEHNYGDVNSCMVDAECSRECGNKVVSQYKETGHTKVESLAYVNGFGAKGTYSCICSNATYCTAMDGYVASEEKAPIITFKGYSNPEAEAYLAINVGYSVDTLLLSEYTRITGESVTIGLFMVNGDIDVADIIDGKTLELADGAKGFSVKVINLNYSSISIEVRGFSKTGETEGSLGNYYTLKLVSAVVVTTTKGENTATHFIQAGVDGADLETKTFNGFDFYLITADAVYGTPEA